ncbi:tyrosine-type recombinase/integrase [Nonomuraea sp. NPDC050790]|uniref:tyrosine-type recombinase/integrase n=1 Tax=Nonomuraea sp. NPDC050790 TaxID=3364371 RepID=UPI0037A13EBA
MRTVVEVQTILDACDRLRDRFLFALLYDSGTRIGEALGMRHADLAAAERAVKVRPRINDNGARFKSQTPRTIPVSAELIRLSADYLHSEYGDLDSDYLFVNLWAEPRGHALTYSAVYDLVSGSPSTRTGIGTPRRRCGCRVLPHGDDCFSFLRLLSASDREKDIEILVRRHQLTVLQRQVNKPAFTQEDRFVLAGLLHRLPHIQQAGHRESVVRDGRRGQQLRRCR